MTPTNTTKMAELITAPSNLVPAESLACRNPVVGACRAEKSKLCSCSEHACRLYGRTAWQPPHLLVVVDVGYGDS